jgi:hypothetical protein
MSVKAVNAATGERAFLRPRDPERLVVFRKFVIAINVCAVIVWNFGCVRSRTWVRRGRELRTGRCGGGVVTTPTRCLQGTAGRKSVSTSAVPSRPSRKGHAVRCAQVSTPVENLTDPPVENLTDRRGDEPQVVVAS